MMSADDGAAASAIGSRDDFVAAVRAAVSCALERRARRMVWADADFADWPLDDAALLEPLTAWVRLPQRRLTLVATHFDGVLRRSPRFVAWRRTWSHAVDAFSPAAGDDDDLPSLLLVDGVRALHRFDPVRCRGRVSDEASALRGWADRIDAFLQRCEPAFPATTLGI